MGSPNFQCIYHLKEGKYFRERKPSVCLSFTYQLECKLYFLFSFKAQFLSVLRLKFKLIFFPLFSGCFSEPNDDCHVIEVASNATKKCIFPFGDNTWREYNGCIDGDDPGKFWCPTKVDLKDKHIRGVGYWGHCGQNCYIEKKSKGELSLSWPDLTLSYLT